MCRDSCPCGGHRLVRERDSLKSHILLFQSQIFFFDLKRRPEYYAHLADAATVAWRFSHFPAVGVRK